MPDGQPPEGSPDTRPDFRPPGWQADGATVDPGPQATPAPQAAPPHERQAYDPYAQYHTQQAMPDPYANPGGAHAAVTGPAQPPSATSPAAAVAPAAGAPGRRSSRPWLVGGAVVALVALLGVIASQLGGHTTGAAGGGASSAAAATSSPTAVARAFLQAWSRGDSQGMRDVMLGDPESPQFLTDDVLKKQLAAAPVTDIQVSEGSGATVRATWGQGGTAMSSPIETYKGYDGTYKVTWHGRTSLYDLATGNQSVTVDGVPTSESSVQLLPGRHSLAMSNPQLAPTRSSVTVTSFVDDTTYDGKLGYAAKTQAVLRAATKKKMSSCLAAKRLDNPACGINFNARTLDGATLDPTTMSCSITQGGSTLAHVTYEPDSTDPSQGRADLSLTITCHVRATNGDSYRGTQSLYRASVDTGASPVTVTFD